MAKRIKKKTKKKKIILTVEQKKQREADRKLKAEQRKYITQVRTVFLNAGFKRIPTDGKKINYKGRSGELDDVFLLENVLVVCEQTSAKNNVGGHLLSKSHLYKLIKDAPSEFIEFVVSEFPLFAELRNPTYENDHYKVIVLYCSRHGVADEHKELVSNTVHFLDYPTLHYLLALSNTIKLSSRYEVFRFLGLKFAEVAENSLSSNTGSGTVYEGSILPESHSSFDSGYKVVTFYIDPEALIKRAYVLRKDSGIDGGVLYQRALIRQKVSEMRSYLRAEKRVFVNNIIATLSEDTKFLDSKNNTIDVTTTKKTSPVRIQLPNDFNSICIIDGQHRIFAYHERDDNYEADIASLRKKQNLLVTAIYYPEAVSQEERSKFEAKLFLEINDKQRKVRSELKQDIEFILKPYSAISISKDLVLRFGIKGPLSNLIGQYDFDKDKLKTASIVTYGLKPLVKLSGDDSLFALWDDPNKNLLLSETDDTVLTRYKAFCEEQINKLLYAFKKSVDRDRWHTGADGFVKITIVNGIIALMRQLIQNKKVGEIDYYINKLKGLDSFKFDDYKASHWNALGVKLYQTYFA